MRASVSVGALALGLALAVPASASDVGYIYGRVVTVDGDQYEGQLRWGKEEAFWDDIFNANKVENENLDYVDHDVLNRMRWREPWRSWGLFFGNRNRQFTHLFAIRFGDLSRIRVRGGHDLVVEFRNGEQLKLDDGSNDVGARVTVVDPRHGIQTLEWDRIRSIEFRETPAKLAKKLGDPLYGTVKSGNYEFTGHIQWDNDECLSIDELDGDTGDGDAAIAFGEIASIRKHRRGVLVRMKSGAELYLSGSNDVNRRNRGIVVKIANLGSVKIG